MNWQIVKGLLLFSQAGFTALMTASGAAMVFLFRKNASPQLHRMMLGFTAGVMIAASMWSLLIPAIEEAQEMGMIGWVPAAGGSALGIAFLRRIPSTGARGKHPANGQP